MIHSPRQGDPKSFIYDYLDIIFNHSGMATIAQLQQHISKRTAAIYYIAHIGLYTTTACIFIHVQDDLQSLFTQPWNIASLLLLTSLQPPLHT